MAVLLVLLYHAGVPGFGGGYVGVDVFFALSGFLITGLIVRELDETGTVSLVAFYARRARRLLPAAALVIVVTVVASAVFLPPLRVPEIARDGAAAALYASNLRFAFQATDYLQAELDPSPLLHFWSLGVEEQFYLFWPALLLIAARGGRGSTRGGSGRLGRISPLGRIGPRDRLGPLDRRRSDVTLPFSRAHFTLREQGFGPGGLRLLAKRIEAVEGLLSSQDQLFEARFHVGELPREVG